MCPDFFQLRLLISSRPYPCKPCSSEDQNVVYGIACKLLLISVMSLFLLLHWHFLISQFDSSLPTNSGLDLVPIVIHHFAAGRMPP